MALALMLILTQLGFPVAHAAERLPAMARAKAAQPAQTQTKPRLPVSHPSPRPPRDAGVKVKPKAPLPKALVLGQRSSGASRPATETPAFVLGPGPAPGKLLLTFHPPRPGRVLDPRAPLLIQLSSPEGLELEPAVITRGDWPKGANQLTLAYKKTHPLTGPQKIAGGAAFTTCEPGSRNCQKSRSRILFTFQP